ncbi:Integrator complex subunit 5 [Entomophthora muscae]|uniref:Integrator complex subunit 5 n=1 Tax=Entomophthora muscae TaxID=34485 RepID=A0ACC2SVR2_9FUNG|nr:Integrator complex subunit 5 [Entomophthora muscae]
MARLKFNQRCLYREHARGSCANPIKALGDCLLGLLHSKKRAIMDRELYSSRCDSLYTALECLLMNVATKEELQTHMAYLMAAFKLESNSYNTPIGDYLNRLFQFYLKSLGGNETDLIGFLKAADSDSLPSLLNSIIALARLKSIVLTSQSEVFRAIIGLAKDNFENKHTVLALVELCLMYLDENSKPPVTTLPSIYYKMSDFGFKALFFAFQQRCRFGTETDLIIGIAKKLLCRLLSLQDPFVFIKQLFSFVVPAQPPPKQAPAPVDQRKSTSRLIDENKIHYFFSDFNKPIFEPLPAQTIPNSSRPNSFPLNILEALGSNKAADAVKCNILDLMDLCLTLSQIEPDSTFLIAGAIGLTFDICGESVVELSTLPDFKVSDFQPKRDVMILARFKEHPILMDMLALISSEPTAFKKAQVVWASLFRSLMHFWTRKFSNKPSEFPKELFLIKRLVHILGLAKWLPPPYHYVSELFDLIDSHEVGEILLFSIWPLLRKVKTPANPRVISGPIPTIGASISLSNSLNLDYVPPELDIIIRALKAHTSETLHLFPLIYART